MRGCCDASCHDGGKFCKAGCEGMVWDAVLNGLGIF